jgi:hypothetical protein
MSGAAKAGLRLSGGTPSPVPPIVAIHDID